MREGKFFCQIIYCLIYFYSCKKVGMLKPPPPPSPSLCAVPAAELRANDRKLRDLCRPDKINDKRKIDKSSGVHYKHKGKREATDG